MPTGSSTVLPLHIAQPGSAQETAQARSNSVDRRMLLPSGKQVPAFCRPPEKPLPASVTTHWSVAAAVKGFSHQPKLSVDTFGAQLLCLVSSLASSLAHGGD